MNTLMLDVGGSNVKAMVEPFGELRKLPSGPELTAKEMAAGIRELTTDWSFDRLSIGFPSLIHDGLPAREPLNLGGGWLEFDYSAAFDGRPVRFINDAALQALGCYHQGRLLFLGFGTSVGACLIADDVVVPIEIGLIKLTRKTRLMDRLSKEALKNDGIDAWMEAVHEAVETMQDVFHPDETVLGGGNTKKIDSLPKGCRTVTNENAFLGALRLWEDADFFAEPDVSTWKIRRSHGS